MSAPLRAHRAATVPSRQRPGEALRPRQRSPPSALGARSWPAGRAGRGGGPRDGHSSRVSLRERRGARGRRREHRPRRGAGGSDGTVASAPRLRGSADSALAASSWPPHGGDRRRLRRPGRGGRRRGAAPQRRRTGWWVSRFRPTPGGHGAGRPRAHRPRGLPRPPLGGLERRLGALRDRSGHQSAVATAGAGGR